MKRIFCCVFILLFLNLEAQEFRKFKWGIQLGGSITSGALGISFASEPGYRITDQLAINLRLEAASYKREEELIPSYRGEGFEYVSIYSTSLNVQYYFSNNAFRPFVSLGLGIYTPGKEEVSTTSTNINSGSTTTISRISTDPSIAFGFYPRVGFDYGHFTMLLEYNFAFDSDANVNMEGSNNVSMVESKIKNSYLGIRAGVTIWGGRKEKKE